MKRNLKTCWKGYRTCKLTRQSRRIRRQYRSYWAYGQGQGLFDTSLKEANNMVGGANKPEYHITGIDVSRDLKGVRFDDLQSSENEKCPVCGHELNLENGIEVGNIFQLGDKYTKGMNMTVLNREGKAQHPIMGCYGIGIGRALSSVAEESNDEYGLIWPMSIAPCMSIVPLKA